MNMQPILETKKQITTAFKDLPPSDQKEVYQTLTDYLQSDDLTHEMYQLATESLADVWDNEENDHWDQFLKENSKTAQ